jgi:multidrug resistance efflux pump
MTPERLPPIPSPPEHHWRQIRASLLPCLTFAAVLALAVWLWGKNLATPVIIGQAEAPQADVTTFQAGRLTRLTVHLFQQVQAGDVVAIIEASDPLVLSNTIAVVRAEMELIRADGGMDAGDKTRLADFRLSWMIRRAELTAAKAQLNWAQAEFDRITKLAAEKFSSQFELDVARRDRDQYALEVAERGAAVEAAEKAWKELDPSTSKGESQSTKAALALAERQLQLAEAELQPIKLTAPISGIVSKIDKYENSAVATGDAIMTIASATPDRIVGFVSQPIRLEPKVGMRAEVRTRGAIRTLGQTQVTHVGPRIELFDAPLRVRGMGAAQERGLPIVMALPPNIHVRPGELVDIRLLVN